MVSDSDCLCRFVVKPPLVSCHNGTMRRDVSLSAWKLHSEDPTSDVAISKPELCAFKPQLRWDLAPVDQICLFPVRHLLPPSVVSFATNTTTMTTSRRENDFAKNQRPLLSRGSFCRER